MYLNNMKFLSKKSRGFTLIELLVVISIIGLLSSVVLAALGGTRDKAKVSKIRSGVLELRKAIELGRSSDGSYANLPTIQLCGNTASPVDPSLSPIVSDILSVTGRSFGSGPGPLAVAAGTIGMVIYTDAYGSCPTAISGTTNNVAGGVPTRYAIWAALAPTPGASGYVCVDSTGNSVGSTTATFVGFKDPLFMTGGYCQ